MVQYPDEGRAVNLFGSSIIIDYLDDSFYV